MASEREQIRNALLAALSHDLRTPLTVLLGQAEDLNARSGKRRIAPRPPGQRDSSACAEHHRLVNNLLDMARIQSGGFNLKKSG
ncbi:histidine kinase dimerization/phospho-acceptor domain-containing protein [Escherichia coli]